MRTNALINASKPYMTDGGMETVMIFKEGFDLPHFAAFKLIGNPRGEAALRAYFDRFINIAATAGRGFVLDTNTWRANISWGPQIGMSDAEILEVNIAAVAFAMDIRTQYETPQLPIIVNGVVGPAGDGYAADNAITSDTAKLIHAPQIGTLAKAGVDMISALTMTHTAEATGIALAARESNIPAVISFTLETDGRLPSGEALGDAIAKVDAATGSYPLYYMINCAHPDHFRDAIASDKAWTKRIGGIRANASRMSHAELDVAEELDEGNPLELGELHAELLRLLPNIRVLGGCCGTDHRHVGHIAQSSVAHHAA